MKAYNNRLGDEEIYTSEFTTNVNVFKSSCAVSCHFHPSFQLSHKQLSPDFLYFSALFFVMCQMSNECHKTVISFSLLRRIHFTYPQPLHNLLSLWF
jgi:hypothetical protein